MIEVSQLGDPGLRTLAATFEAKVNTPYESFGYGVRGQGMKQGAVMAMIPRSPKEYALSFCGVKGFMIDEWRLFERASGLLVVIACARVAILWIKNSPLHDHDYTTETYTILGGRGRMVLGDEVMPVQRGSEILIPPRLPHGLMSDTKRAIKARLSFTPGLAGKEWIDEYGINQHRDERDLKILTSERITQLQTAY